MALESILSKVSSVIMFNDSMGTSAHQTTQPVHELAVYSLCPTTTPILDIFRSNNNSFNLFFDPPTHALNDNRMYLSSAILRLFKVDHSGTGNGETESRNDTVAECKWNPAHADDLIRVTVSAYTRKQRKRRWTTGQLMIPW